MDLTQILTQQNELMDQILDSQKALRKSVVDRSWIDLQKSTALLNDLSAKFKVLDLSRSNCEQEAGPVEKVLISQIRSKLLKSRIENTALTDYVKITQGFVQNILEKAVPNRRSVVYSKNGTIVKSQPSSVVLNKVL